MSVNNILTLIDAEIAQLQRARTLLAGAGKRGLKLKSSASAAQPKRKRKLSSAGRARIAAAQKARWAATKKKAKKGS